MQAQFRSCAALVACGVAVLMPREGIRAQERGATHPVAGMRARIRGAQAPELSLPAHATTTVSWFEPPLPDLRVDTYVGAGLGAVSGAIVGLAVGPCSEDFCHLDGFLRGAIVGSSIGSIVGGKFGPDKWSCPARTTLGSAVVGTVLGTLPAAVTLFVASRDHRDDPSGALAVAFFSLPILQGEGAARSVSKSCRARNPVLRR